MVGKEGDVRRETSVRGEERLCKAAKQVERN